MWQFQSCLQFINMMMFDVLEIWKRIEFTFHRFFFFHNRNRWGANTIFSDCSLVCQFLCVKNHHHNYKCDALYVQSASIYLCFARSFDHSFAVLLSQYYVIVLWMNISFLVCLLLLLAERNNGLILWYCLYIAFWYFDCQIMNCIFLALFLLPKVFV